MGNGQLDIVESRVPSSAKTSIRLEPLSVRGTRHGDVNYLFNLLGYSMVLSRDLELLFVLHFIVKLRSIYASQRPDHA